MWPHFTPNQAFDLQARCETRNGRPIETWILSDPIGGVMDDRR
jgi:hypothetical protein